ncbi:MAG: ABC transporter permease, partial [Pirellulales bacterium]
AIENRLEGPSSTFLLGTDTFGRDVLSRLLWGARVSLIIGTVSVLLAMVIGGPLGLVAGYFGGLIDQIIMRMMDVLLSFPLLLMGLLIVAVLGPSVLNLIIAIAIPVIPKFARIARAPTIAVRERNYIVACQALGYSHLRIMARHILPNILGEVVVMASLWAATAVRIEASLSFIGLGVKPPTPTWGGMIQEGFEYILDAPWLSIYPGLAVLVLVLSLNLLGDGLRDAIDPKLREGQEA